MDIDVLISFVVVSVVLVMSPGPTVFLVVAQALKHGKRSLWPLVAGALTGDLISMVTSFVGLGAILATSAELFTLVKWVGGAYLIYLGFKAWQVKPVASQQQPAQGRGIYRDVMLVTAFNPKGIIFFMAFFPLFLDAESAVLPQMIISAVAFLAVSACNVVFYALLSACVRERVWSVRGQCRFNRVAGTMLIGAGVVTLNIEQ
ncbi:MAG: LysE family translocator [Chromatiales bacterium]|nr:LysE family translocator [Chromatiales bacterium]